MIYDHVRIEIRATCRYKPDLKYYQVMRICPRECVTGWLTREQAIKFCETYNLEVIEIIDKPKNLCYNITRQEGKEK